MGCGMSYDDRLELKSEMIRWHYEQMAKARLLVIIALVFFILVLCVLVIAFALNVPKVTAYADYYGSGALPFCINSGYDSMECVGGNFERCYCHKGKESLHIIKTPDGWKK